MVTGCLGGSYAPLGADLGARSGRRVSSEHAPGGVRFSCPVALADPSDGCDRRTGKWI
jgi:hypothetical protein